MHTIVHMSDLQKPRTLYEFLCLASSHTVTGTQAYRLISRFSNLSLHVVKFIGYGELFIQKQNTKKKNA